MKSSRRFIYDCNLGSPEIVINDQELSSQIRSVLRLKVNDVINVCDGKGKEAEAKILEIDKNKLRLEVLKMFVSDQEDLKKINVYCSILKRENFEMVVQKCTEIGVAEIVPILTKRTVKSGLKTDRLRKIAKEAAEQSGRLWIPIIGQPKDFARAIEEAEEEKIFFHLVDFAEKKPIKKSYNTRSIFIGPEGGWDDEEIEIAERNKAVIMPLGKLALRAETAAIIASYLTYHDFI